MKSICRLGVAALVVLGAASAFAQPSQPPLDAAERTRWFQDAKFGVFIHWGVYSVVGRHEWARHRFEIPQAEYDKIARTFNPVNFNADAWVDLAKNAGARYMVITSKHHDGFSIYRSKVSDYDMEITPYKGDPLKLLADAAKKKNLRFGFYHSIMDWHHPDYIPKRDWEVPGQTTGGNIDKYTDHAAGKPYEGVAVRLFNPATRLWSIYWADGNSGTLDPPVVGSFENKIGHFFTKDTYRGTPIVMVFRWDVRNPERPIWSQAFSTDQGKTWEWNSINVSERAAH